MIVKVNQPMLINGFPDTCEVDVDRLNINTDAIISIDGSTTNTGIAIMRSLDGAVFATISVKREDSKEETPVRYKLRLKKFVAELLKRYRCITTLLYEEPCIDNITAIPNTMMLRTFVEEMVIENEPEFDNLYTTEINNKRWKKIFLNPEPCPVGTDAEKAAVKNKILRAMPYMHKISQDEMDAIGMGYAFVTFIRGGNDRDSLRSKKAVKPFEYKVQFIGGDDDDDFIVQFADAYKGPNEILTNGINIATLKKTSKFDKHIYEAMGDDDKLLVIKYDSRTHGDTTLKYRLGDLESRYAYIYAIVWRKTRKKK